MRIYLSTEQPEDTTYIWANSLPMLDSLSLDSESLEIVCKNFISSFEYSDIRPLLQRIYKKMRLGCKLTIIEKDIDLLCRSFYVEELDINTINQILFSLQKRKSVFNITDIESSLPSGIQVTHKHYESGDCSFILKCKRVS
jgi:hypothetical protein